MKARRNRELREDEVKARKKYNGMTRRQYNASKRDGRRSTTSGNYEIQALFRGQTQPQNAPFNNEQGALARLDRLSTNPALLSVRVVHHWRDDNGIARQSALYSLTKTGQEFANGQDPWWSRKA